MRCSNWWRPDLRGYECDDILQLVGYTNTTMKLRFCLKPSICGLLLTIMWPHQHFLARFRIHNDHTVWELGKPMLGLHIQRTQQPQHRIYIYIYISSNKLTGGWTMVTQCYWLKFNCMSVREHLQKAICKKNVIVLSIKGHRIFTWKAEINGHQEGKLMS